MPLRCRGVADETRKLALALTGRGFIARMWVEDVAGCGEVAFAGCGNEALVVAALRLACVCGRGRVERRCVPVAAGGECAMCAQCVSWGVRNPVAGTSCFLARPNRSAQLIGGRPFVGFGSCCGNCATRSPVCSGRVHVGGLERGVRKRISVAACVVCRRAQFCAEDTVAVARVASYCASSCTSAQLEAHGDGLVATTVGEVRSGPGRLRLWLQLRLRLRRGGASGGYAMPGVRVHAITSINQRPATWVVVIVWVNCVAGSPGRISVRTSV